MTDTMTMCKPMAARNGAAIRMLPQLSPERAARLRARRRRALVNTLLEALATIGLGACFILCAVMILALA